MQNFRKVIIVGAGPIGLYFASLCEKNKIDYLILEATDKIGGQITRLYPQKDVVDLPNIECIKAEDYIKELGSKINLEKVIFNEAVIDVKNEEQIKVLTHNEIYFCEYLVFATGLGTTVPRPLGVDGENDCSNIIYNIHSFEHLKNKRVAIFGGGDSALDWAKAISNISDDVHLIHRRTEFRGNPETIKDCKNLKLHLPYIPVSIQKRNDLAESVLIKKVDSEETLEIPVDFIFVNYGNIPRQFAFPFESEGAFLKVDKNLKISERIFAIGDVAQYENKTRRMAPGINEANIVFKQILN